MKRILCYGDSNTWGSRPMHHAQDTQRWGPEVRWTRVMASSLGQDWEIIEEGLPGRTTVFDDFFGPFGGEHRNGRKHLLPTLLSQAPINGVILMLGTNDVKAQFGVAASQVAAGVESLIDLIQMTPLYGGSPRILLMCPPPVTENGWLAEIFAGGPARSHQLPQLYATLAQRKGVAYFDAGQHIQTSQVDGVHFEAEAHIKLGQELAQHLPQFF
jgi:lysophospholipase L1-like esterase